MKRIIIVSVIMIMCAAVKAQVNIPYREIHYDVKYQWGLMDIMIARGVVTIQTEGDSFFATLNGNSIPWEGRVFCISDTLRATMTPGSEYSRETVDYENGWYMKPKSDRFVSDKTCMTDPVNYKNIQGGGTLNADASTMEAVRVTCDMLGLFYYFREIDFEVLSQERQISIPFTGNDGSSGNVTLTYNCKTDYKLDGIPTPVYDVTFEYGYDGSMTGYPVKALVGVSDRIPLVISANLPIGHIEMIYSY